MCKEPIVSIVLVVKQSTTLYVKNPEPMMESIFERKKCTHGRFYLFLNNSIK